MAAYIDEFLRLWNKQEVDVIDAICHDRIVIHSLLGKYYGPQALKHIVKSWFAAFPDLRCLSLSSAAENNKVFIQWEATGTHQGEFKGIAPTSKSVAYTGVTVYQVEHQKITNYWSYLDMDNLLGQLRS